MKIAHLKAAAHNMADSISSECSLISWDYDFHLWSYIAQNPEQRLRVNLLTGELRSEGLWPTRVSKFFADFAGIVPEMLAKHECPIEEVSAIEVEFCRLPIDKEVTVTVQQANGKASTDRYVGTPLARPRILDNLGRIRT